METNFEMDKELMDKLPHVYPVDYIEKYCKLRDMAAETLNCADEKTKEFIEKIFPGLKTQQHKTAPEQLYIRFGEIPADERSKIYRGGYDVIGVEEGVSVYPAFKDNNGNYAIGLTLPVTANALRTQQILMEDDNRKCYLVKGNYVGRGSDGEPLIRDVEIIAEITNYIRKKENNTN